MLKETERACANGDVWTIARLIWLFRPLPIATPKAACESTGTFQGLTAVGWLGIAGLQHFYLGKTMKGCIWFFTLGLFFVGTLVDHVTAGQQVRNANPAGPGLSHQPPAAPHFYYPAPAPMPTAVAPRGDSSHVTVEQIKAIASGSLASALRELDKLRYERLLDDHEFAALKAKLIRDYHD